MAVATNPPRLGWGAAAGRGVETRGDRRLMRPQAYHNKAFAGSRPIANGRRIRKSLQINALGGGGQSEKKCEGGVDRPLSRPYISVCPQQDKEDASKQARVVSAVDSGFGDLLVSASASEAARGLRVAFTTPDL